MHKQSNASSDIVDLNVTYFDDSSIQFNFAIIPGGFKNFVIQGIVRFVLRLDGKATKLQIYFLDDPKVDFETSGIAALVGLKYNMLLPRTLSTSCKCGRRS